MNRRGGYVDGIMGLKAFLLKRKKAEEKMAVIFDVSKGAISVSCSVSLQEKKTTVMVLFAHLLYKMYNNYTNLYLILS